LSLRFSSSVAFGFDFSLVSAYPYRYGSPHRGVRLQGLFKPFLSCFSIPVLLKNKNTRSTHLGANL